MKFPKLSPQNERIPYPDHVKIPLKPYFSHNSYPPNYETRVSWQWNDGERDLIYWLEKNVGPIHGSSYNFPMSGKGWAFVECCSLDHNPDDYAWRRQNPYRPQGEHGFFLVIEDTHSNAVTELLLNGLLERARTERPRCFK